MRLLLDTHLLLWAAEESSRLSAEARALICDVENELFFSAISIAEIAIKYARKRPDFEADPRLIRGELLRHDYVELPVTSEHAVALAELPVIHGDPFDRLLVAQARVEGVMLLTSDATMALYGGVVRAV